ncbi:LysR family transcriptional regulator [Aeromonas veronii]|uniref:LysR family transcriptional regulator n=1 Tax=Aeromonas veronii TaxID=654 RepID=UPI003D220E99
MTKIKLNDLMAIRCIAEEKKINAAAKRLGNSPANLSRLLTNIESKMGLKIFHRTTRYIYLTEFGESLLLHIKHFLQSHDEILNFIDSYKNQASGRITLAAPSGAILFLTRYIIPSIALEYPEISISFVTYQPQSNDHATKTEMLPNWDVLFSLNPPIDESLVARQVVNFSIGLFASPEYMKHHPFEHPRELSAHPCILLHALGGAQFNTWQYRNGDEIQNVVVTGKYICDNALPAIELAKNGLGILYAPQYMIKDELDNGVLIPCMSSQSNVEMPNYLIYRKRERQPRKIHVFIDAVIKYLDAHATLFR